jgi:hypothetical protein
MSAGLRLAARLKLIMARRPTTDEETERSVEDIEGIIRELDALQMWLYKAQRNRNKKLAAEELSS